ncbi:hypothetical protein M404DRAFT_30328 [Pisolithus tinctorius Marx 270]|uniref:Uncharacterized protein n=1 Tax=Pisolithus tinctorius Marx 270 TaxID=870435 RepID=A0A0C3NWU2_PISTI|nr:hypothetical protein M404DRAFT_30328 [Pisolithus tinctorius Marx 270]
MVNTHATAHRATKARASSLPPSPSMTQPGADIGDKSSLPKLTPIGSQYSTPIERPITDNIWSYSDMVRTGSRDPSPAPKGAAATLPGSRVSSPIDPGSRASLPNYLGLRVTSPENPGSRIASPMNPGDIEVPEAVKARAVRVWVLTHEENENLPDKVQCDSIFPMSKIDVEYDKASTTQRDLKGKGPDPRNWGNLNFSDGEIDTNAQRTALASWNTLNKLASKSDPNLMGPAERGNLEDATSANKDVPQKKASGGDDRAERLPKKEKSKRRENTKKPAPSKVPPNPVKEMVDKVVCQDHKRWEHQKMPRAMEPVKQINPKSYIGLAFKCLEKDEKHTSKTKRKRKSTHRRESTDNSKSSSSSSDGSESSSLEDDSSSDPSTSLSSKCSTSSDDGSASESDDMSSTSGSSSSSSESSSSSSRSRGHWRRGRSKQRKSHSRRAHKSKRRSRPRRKTTLKPIPPNKYDGVGKAQVAV